MSSTPIPTDSRCRITVCLSIRRSPRHTAIRSETARLAAIRRYDPPVVRLPIVPVQKPTPVRRPDRPFRGARIGDLHRASPVGVDDKDPAVVEDLSGLPAHERDPTAIG